MTWIAPVYLRILMDRAAHNPEPPDDPALTSEALEYAQKALDGEIPAPHAKPALPETATVTVCSHCLKASCWKGVHLCEAVRAAATVELPVPALVKLGREHSQYWDGTYEREAAERAAMAGRNDHA